MSASCLIQSLLRGRAASFQAAGACTWAAQQLPSLERWGASSFSRCSSTATRGALSGRAGMPAHAHAVQPVRSPHDWLQQHGSARGLTSRASGGGPQQLRQRNRTVAIYMVRSPTLRAAHRLAVKRHTREAVLGRHAFSRRSARHVLHAARMRLRRRRRGARSACRAPSSRARSASRTSACRCTASSAARPATVAPSVRAAPSRRSCGGAPRALTCRWRSAAPLPIAAASICRSTLLSPGCCARCKHNLVTLAKAFEDLSCAATGMWVTVLNSHGCAVADCCAAVQGGREA
jgi:hypothetical protein